MSTLEERLWAKVHKTDSCWLWLGGRSPGGPGHIRTSDRKSERAHLVAWKLSGGEDPEGRELLRRCPSPLCVRPDHRYLGEKLRASSFEEKYSVTQSGCWEWTWSRYPGGYGRHGHNLQAHRASWEIHRGPVPDGLRVLHRCDNPPCVNPDHLFLGTQSDNMVDMHAKGRHPQGRPREMGR